MGAWDFHSWESDESMDIRDTMMQKMVLKYLESKIKGNQYDIDAVGVILQLIHKEVLFGIPIKLQKKCLRVLYRELDEVATTNKKGWRDPVKRIKALKQEIILMEKYPL